MRLLLPLLASVLLAPAARAQTVPALPADQVRFEAFYRLTYRLDSTAPATHSEIMRLQIGSKVSRFESLTAVRGDSASWAQAKAAFAEAQTGITPVIKVDASYASRFRGQAIFKVPATKQVVVSDKIERLLCAYVEPAAPSWTLAPGITTVAGYPCQRASAAWGGRVWEAWFTREVPIADGPYKFYGLPGLIVRVADTRGHYAFELAKLRQLPAPVPLVLPDAQAKPTTKDVFLQAKADYTRSATDRLLNSGNLRFNTPEEEADFRRRGRERARRPTNPIELQ